MEKTMKGTALFAIAATLILTGIFIKTENALALTLTITAGTIAYHFAMRLAVGGVVNGVMHNRADCDNAWFRERKFEGRIYRAIHVKKWKEKMPTYDPGAFSLREHSPDEILGAMCQAEITHEIIIVLSFAPMFAACWCGAFWVFLITSVLAAALDAAFVILQRYNRPRILKMARRKRCRTDSADVL